MRDADAFEEFCENHLIGLRTQVRDSWEVLFEVACADVVLRRFLPPMIVPATFGPFPADQLMNAHHVLRQSADHLWTSRLQAHRVANVEVFKGTGMTIQALHTLYRWLWGTKDGSGDNLVALDDRIRKGYTQLARSLLEKGDDGAAAQYSKVAFDLSPTDDIAEEISVEFAHLSAHWDELAAVKENSVKRVATVAREGIAEWWSLVSGRYYRDGLIAPITDEIKALYSSDELEARRQEIRGWSATNPSRCGLELMEKIESHLGFPTAMLAGIITEWPLEELRRRVPASAVVEQIRRGSPWAPDTRLEKLAELSYADIRWVPFTGEVMPYLHTIHRCLDDALPGIVTYALEQLPDA